MPWKDDPRLPFAIAALLGLAAGLAGKQAVAISTGDVPKPLTILADVLILGVVFLIVMYGHSIFPSVPVEGVALSAASLAMWGPRGIAALVAAFRKKTIDKLGLEVIEPVDPVKRPTVEVAVETPAADGDDNKHAQVAPIRKMRDKIELEKHNPADMVGLLTEIDQKTIQPGEDMVPNPHDYPAKSREDWHDTSGDKNVGGNDV